MSRAVQLGEVVTQQIVDEQRYLLPLPAPGEIFDVTEPQVAGSGSQHGCARLFLLPVDRLLAANQYQRTRGGNAKGMQRL
jgi:hypothetical protein